MTHAGADPIERFYERHPYPPAVAHLDGYARRVADGRERRLAHHLVWPERPQPDASRVLVAGCGTSQAARHALLDPGAQVVGIDVSATSVEHTRRLAARHGLANLDARRLAIEDVGELDARFDHVVCTGVLHHLADPEAGLASLSGVLAPGGAVTLMVYARHGRTGVALLQEYCRRLGVDPTPGELADLVATLREIPAGHPLAPLLRQARDFHDDDAMADALLNPRERSYSVPELFELLAAAGLRFGRWARQAPYRPDCGSLTETPHGPRIAALPPHEQYAAVELFRGTITRHTAIAFAADDRTSGQLDFAGAGVGRWVPLRPSTAVAVEERLPRGAAAALLNRAHSSTDLVLFVDRRQRDIFGAIDGRRTVAQLGPGALEFVQQLWHHDLVVIDASRGGADR